MESKQEYALFIFGTYPIHVCQQHAQQAKQEFGCEPDAQLPPEVDVCAYCEDDHPQGERTMTTECPECRGTRDLLAETLFPGTDLCRKCAANYKRECADCGSRFMDYWPLERVECSRSTSGYHRDVRD